MRGVTVTPPPPPEAVIVIFSKVRLYKTAPIYRVIGITPVTYWFLDIYGGYNSMYNDRRGPPARAPGPHLFVVFFNEIVPNKNTKDIFEQC